MNTFNPDYDIDLFEFIDEILTEIDMSWNEFLRGALDVGKAGTILDRPQILINLLVRGSDEHIQS